MHPTEQLHTTRFLTAMAENGWYLVHAKGAPTHPERKHDMYYLGDVNGIAQLYVTPKGFMMGRVDVHPDDFEDFKAARYIQEYAPEDDGGHTLYELTPLGREVGLRG